MARPTPAAPEFRAAITELEFSFESQEAQFPALGKPGIGYFAAALSDGARVDVLLHRDAEGRVDGMLFHYPSALPPYQEAGSVNVLVREDRQRQGIGGALVRAGMRRFHFNLPGQLFTPSGAALANRIARKR